MMNADIDHSGGAVITIRSASSFAYHRVEVQQKREVGLKAENSGMMGG
jgi:hypothetical protein